MSHDPSIDRVASWLTECEPERNPNWYIPVLRVDRELRQLGRAETILKPCPFCGGQADPCGWLDGDGNRGPECTGCGATAPSVAIWNTRPTDAIVSNRCWTPEEVGQFQAEYDRIMAGDRRHRGQLLFRSGDAWHVSDIGLVDKPADESQDRKVLLPFGLVAVDPAAEPEAVLLSVGNRAGKSVAGEMQREASRSFVENKLRSLVHDWRAPEPGEPMEEGGVCRRCGRYATSEGQEPCTVMEPDRFRGDSPPGDPGS